MSDSFLQLRGVTKCFDATTALSDLSFDVGSDELLVILGPTGAGKTTLLRTIAGLETADGGSVTMNGRSVTFLSPAGRDVALVFQNFSLYPDRTVRQNMEFPLRAPGRKLMPEQIRERVEWAAGVLRITHLLDRKSARLSGGEMQRVAIGRAIVRRPKLFLMDEPLTNLDAKLREALRVELVTLRSQLKTPMIYVTHDQTEALSMGDRIIVLSAGKILQTGTPEEVYAKPASPVVARQLGQPAINLIDVQRRAEHWAARTGENILPAVGARARATIGVRPEDVQLEGGPSTAVVRIVEQMGATTTVLLAWLGQDIHAVVPSDVRVSVGEEVRPRFSVERAVVWEA